METIFYYFAISSIFLAIITSLFIFTMIDKKRNIMKYVIGFIGITLSVILITILLDYLTLSMFDRIIDFCRESHQTLIVSIAGAIIMLTGLTRGIDLTSIILKIILKLFYIITGLALIWYGINFGYGQLNWNSILTFLIVSGIIECITKCIDICIDWMKEGNSLRELFKKLIN